MEGGPDAGSGETSPGTGLLGGVDPAGPHLSRGRGGQDQQRSGPDSPLRLGSREDRSAASGPAVRVGDGKCPETDRILVAQLAGEARHHAKWRELGEDEEVAAMAELRALADGRAGDLSAEVAGGLEEFSVGETFRLDA